jgi:hypothetical protein
MPGAILPGVDTMAQPPTNEAAGSADESETDGSAPADSVQAGPDVVVYYFHTTYRCPSCKKIEAYSKESIETGFAVELQSGKLRFESVNIDEPDNKHYIKDYQLYTKSLVICDIKDGKQIQWKNLAKVWEHVGNKDVFVKYVQDEINAYLKES